MRRKGRNYVNLTSGDSLGARALKWSETVAVVGCVLLRVYVRRGGDVRAVIHPVI